MIHSVNMTSYIKYALFYRENVMKIVTSGIQSSCKMIFPIVHHDAETICIDFSQFTIPLGYPSENEITDKLKNHCVFFETDSIGNNTKQFLPAIALTIYNINLLVQLQSAMECCAGIGFNRTSAIIAIDSTKNTGIAVIDSQQSLAKLTAIMPINQFPYLNTNNKISIIIEKHFQCKNISELQKISLQSMSQKMGQTGIWLHGLINNTLDTMIDVRPSFRRMCRAD